jgi:hypothetical protein
MSSIENENLSILKSLISNNQKIRYTQIKFIERFLKLYSRAQNFNNYEVRVFQAHEELTDYDTIKLEQFKTWMIQKTRFLKDETFYEPLLFFIRNLNTQIELNEIENAYFEFRDFTKPRDFEKPKRIESSWERPLEFNLNESTRRQLEQFPIMGRTNPRVAGDTIPRVADSKMVRTTFISGSSTGNESIENINNGVTFIDSVTLSIYRNITNQVIKKAFIDVFNTIGFNSEIENLNNESFSFIKTIEDSITLKIYRGMKLNAEIIKLVVDIFESINMTSESKLWRSKLDIE